MDYATLSLAEVAHALRDVASDSEATFGGLDARALNWRPAASRWSVAQCFDHLLAANRLVLPAAQDAMRRDTRTIWERLPVVPRLMGRALIRSQSPHVKRRYNAPAKATPSASDI